RRRKSVFRRSYGTDQSRLRLGWKEIAAQADCREKRLVAKGIVVHSLNGGHRTVEGGQNRRARGNRDTVTMAYSKQIGYLAEQFIDGFGCGSPCDFSGTAQMQNVATDSQIAESVGGVEFIALTGKCQARGNLTGPVESKCGPAAEVRL